MVSSLMLGVQQVEVNVGTPMLILGCWKGLTVLLVSLEEAKCTESFS